MPVSSEQIGKAIKAKRVNKFPDAEGSPRDNVRDQIKALVAELKKIEGFAEEEGDLSFFINCLNQNTFSPVPPAVVKDPARFNALINGDDDRAKAYVQIMQQYVWQNGFGDRALDDVDEIFASGHARSKGTTESTGILKITKEPVKVEIDKAALAEKAKDPTPMGSFYKNSKEFLKEKADALARDHGGTPKEPMSKDEASVIMQSAARVFIAKSKINRMKEEAKAKLQEEAKAKPQEEADKKRSAMTIQSAWRGFKERKEYQGILDHEGDNKGIRDKVVTIQSVMRIKLAKNIANKKRRAGGTAEELLDSLAKEVGTNTEGTSDDNLNSEILKRIDELKKDVGELRKESVQGFVELEKKLKKDLLAEIEKLEKASADPEKTKEALVGLNKKLEELDGSLKKQIEKLGEDLGKKLDAMAKELADTKEALGKQQRNQNLNPNQNPNRPLSHEELARDYGDILVPSIIGGSGFEKGEGGVDRSGMELTPYGLPIAFYSGREVDDTYPRQVNSAIETFAANSDPSHHTSLSGKSQRTLVSVARLEERTKDNQSCYSVVTVTARGVSQLFFSDEQFKSEIEAPLQRMHDAQVEVLKKGVEPKKSTEDFDKDSVTFYREVVNTMVAGSEKVKAQGYLDKAEYVNLHDQLSKLMGDKTGKFKAGTFAPDPAVIAFYTDVVDKMTPGSAARTEAESHLKAGKYGELQNNLVGLMDPNTKAFKVDDFTPQTVIDFYRDVVGKMEAGKAKTDADVCITGGKYSELQKQLSKLIDPTTKKFKAGTFSPTAVAAPDDMSGLPVSTMPSMYDMPADAIDTKWHKFAAKREATSSTEKGVDQSRLMSFEQTLKSAFDGRDEAKAFYKDVVALMKDNPSMIAKEKAVVVTLLAAEKYDELHDRISKKLIYQDNGFYSGVFANPAVSDEMSQRWKKLSKERVDFIEPAVQRSEEVREKADIDFNKKQETKESYRKLFSLMVDGPEKKAAQDLLKGGKYFDLHESLTTPDMSGKRVLNNRLFVPASFSDADAEMKGLEGRREKFVTATQQYSDYGFSAILKTMEAREKELSDSIAKTTESYVATAKGIVNRELWSEIISKMDVSTEAAKDKKTAAQILFTRSDYEELKKSLFESDGKEKAGLFSYPASAVGSPPPAPTAEQLLASFDESRAINQCIATNKGGVFKNTSDQRDQRDELLGMIRKIKNFETTSELPSFQEVSAVIKSTGLKDGVAENIARSNSTACASGLMVRKVNQAVRSDRDKIGLNTEEIAALTRNGTTPTERRMANLLAKELPLSPVEGVSFLNHKNKDVCVSFNGDCTGRHVSYIHIPGSRECYVKATLCTEASLVPGPDGKRGIYVNKDGKPVFEEHKIGDVVIDSGTIMHYCAQFKKNKDGSQGEAIIDPKTGKQLMGYTPMNMEVNTVGKRMGQMVNLLENLTVIGAVLPKLADTRSEIEKVMGCSRDYATMISNTAKNLDIKVVATHPEHGTSVAAFVDGRSQITSEMSREVMTTKINQNKDGSTIKFEFDSKGFLKPQPGMFTTSGTANGKGVYVPGPSVGGVQLFGMVGILTNEEKKADQTSNPISGRRGDLFFNAAPSCYDSAKGEYHKMDTSEGMLVMIKNLQTQNPALIGKDEECKAMIKEAVDKFKKSFSANVVVTTDEVKEYEIDTSGAKPRVQDKSGVLAAASRIETVIRPGSELKASSELKGKLLKIGERRVIDYLLEKPTPDVVTATSLYNSIHGGAVARGAAQHDLDKAIRKAGQGKLDPLGIIEPHARTVDGVDLEAKVRGAIKIDWKDLINKYKEDNANQGTPGYTTQCPPEIKSVFDKIPESERKTRLDEVRRLDVATPKVLSNKEKLLAAAIWEAGRAKSDLPGWIRPCDRIEAHGGVDLEGSIRRVTKIDWSRVEDPKYCKPEAIKGVDLAEIKTKYDVVVKGGVEEEKVAAVRKRYGLEDLKMSQASLSDEEAKVAANARHNKTGSVFDRLNPRGNWVNTPEPGKSPGKTGVYGAKKLADVQTIGPNSPELLVSLSDIKRPNGRGGGGMAAAA